MLALKRLFSRKPAARSQSLPRERGPKGASASIGNLSVDDDESSSDSEITMPECMSAPSVLQYRRTGVDIAAPAPQLPAEVQAGQLRRVQTYELGARGSSGRTGTGRSSSAIQAAYHSVRQCHVGRNAALLEGECRTTGMQVMIKAYAKSRLGVWGREKVGREAEVLRAAQGMAGVVQLVNTLEDDTHLYNVLATVPGYSLIELVANRGGRLAEERAVREVVGPLLVALAELHGRGICHRDLTPEHVMCNVGGVTLLDFHEAVVVPPGRLDHRAGQLQYMAPEVAGQPRAEDVFHRVLAAGMAESDLPVYDGAKADVWAVGAIVYEVLTGRQAFAAECITELVRLHAAWEVAHAAAVHKVAAGMGAGGSSNLARTVLADGEPASGAPMSAGSSHAGTSGSSAAVTFSGSSTAMTSSSAVSPPSSAVTPLTAILGAGAGAPPGHLLPHTAFTSRASTCPTVLHYSSTVTDDSTTAIDLTEGGSSVPVSQVDTLTPTARAFVLATLHPDPAQRPSASQLLQHPWLHQLAGRTSGASSGLLYSLGGGRSSDLEAVLAAPAAVTEAAVSQQQQQQHATARK